jgi:hypothetical protein
MTTPSLLSRLSLALLLLAATLRPAFAIDSALVGTWQGEGAVMTSSMQKTGRYLLRIEPDGRFVLLLRSPTDFAVDSGRFESASRGGFVRKLSTGLEDRGTYRVNGDGLQFSSFYATWSARRANDPRGEAQLNLLATLERTPVRPRISDWVARSRASAQLWQPDAELQYVSISGLGDDGLLRPDTQASIGWYSRRTDQYLVLAPTRTGRGSLTSFVTPRSGRALNPRAIPVPIRDVDLLVKGQRARGFRGGYGAIELRSYGPSPAQSRVMWLATVRNSLRFERHCWDVESAQITDCRPLAGDPEKDYRELEARAAAAWAALNRQAAGGSVDGAALELPPSDYDRCGGAGGRMGEGSRCYNASGDVIHP